MTDETPPDPAPRRAPVPMGLRVVARHSAGRAGGREFAHGVVESHRPKRLEASTRLSPVARSAAPAPPAPPAPAPAPAPAASEPVPAPAPSPSRPGPVELPRGMSEFAAEWLFGDQATASASLMSMAEAEKLPEPTKEERVARFIARGGLERSRGARIVEGSGTGPISPEQLGMADAPESPKRLARAPLAEHAAAEEEAVPAREAGAPRRRPS